MEKLLQRIILLKEGVSTQLVDSLREYLEGKLPPKIAVSLEHISYDERAPAILASLRIRGPRGERREPLPLEIEVEKEGIKKGSPPKGVIYDGWEYMRYIRSLLPFHSPSLLYILLTSRLLSTEEGGMHHIRTILLGYPCIISTSGLVEGPARSKKFYVARRLFGDENLYYQVAEKEHFLQPDDPRLPYVIRGYALQALFYQLTGKPFCEDKGCSLYNAHFQDEMIYAQLESPYELCPYHKNLLEEFHYG
ncbi:MAG: DUF6775 family putative metallopeptidase [bacterium]